MSRAMIKRGESREDHAVLRWSMSRVFRFYMEATRGQNGYWDFVKQWKEWREERERITGERPKWNKTWYELAKELKLFTNKEELRAAARELFDIQGHIITTNQKLSSERQGRRRQLEVLEQRTWDHVFGGLSDGKMSEYEEYYAWALRHPVLHRQRNLPVNQKIVLTGEDIVGAPSKIAANLLCQALDNPAAFFNRAHDVGKAAVKEAAKQVAEDDVSEMTMAEIDQLIAESLTPAESRARMEEEEDDEGYDLQV